jgi:hypothetical protein
MSQYTIITNFVSKDSLPSGNALKLVKGADFTTEFTAVQTAVNTKIDGAGQYFPDGTAAQPSAGFTSIAGTGMYNVSGVLNFATGSTLRLSIGTDGGLTIGSPTGGDEGAGTLNIAGGLYLNGAQVYVGIPSTTTTASRSTTSADSNTSIYATTTAGMTITITGGPTTHPVGTAVSFFNRTGGSISIAMSTDSMFFAGVGSTGTRTLANYGQATAYHASAGVWVISGAGLT